MDQKPAIWLGMVAGSFLGGFISSLFGSTFLSVPSLIMIALGALAGIWLGYEFTK